VETHRALEKSLICFHGNTYGKSPHFVSVETYRALESSFCWRGNTQGAGKVPVNRPWTGRTRMWKGMEGDGEDLEESGSEPETKRRWEKSGLAWMKKSGDQTAWNEDGKPGDGGGDSKRRWKSSTLYP